MSKKTGKKLGFFAALTMLIGSVVGIGIFFKSHGVLRATEHNGLATLLAWLIGGLLSLAAAVSFAEIGSGKTGKVSGIAAYSEQLGGKKFGYFVRFNHSFFYFGILSIALGFFGSEIIVGMVASWIGKSVSDVPMWAHALIALSVSAFFLVVNFISVKASGWIAQISTILKWVPLVLVAVLGIVMATTNKAGGTNAFANGNDFKFTGMLAALPAVLFAYDSFLNVLSMKDKVEGGTEKLPKIVVVGMIAVLVLYTLIALSAILHNSGMVSSVPFGPDAFGIGIFDQLFAKGAAEAMGKFVIVFLAISTLGVINGISGATVSLYEQATTSNTYFGAKTLRAKFGDNKATYIITAAVTAFWFVVISIPALLLKSDSIVDGFSNYPTLFYFAIYAVVILLYTLKRDKLTNKKINNVLFKAFAWIAIVGIFLVVGYQFIYGYLIQAMIHPADTTHWGLYLGDNGINAANPAAAFPKIELGQYMSLAQAAILQGALLVAFLTIPVANWWLTKKFENNNVIVNTQA